MDTEDILDCNVELQESGNLNQGQEESESSQDPIMVQSTDALTGQKKLLKQALPLMLLIALNLVYQNTIYIILFISLAFVFDRLNDMLLRHSTSQDGKSFKFLICIFFYVLLVTILTIPTLNELWLFNLFQMKSWFLTHQTFWKVLFDIAIADFLIKLNTIAVKSLVTILSPKLLPRQKLGGVYIMLESISQFARSFIPTLEWIKYIVSSPSCFAVIVCWLFAALYVALKVSAFKTKHQLFMVGYSNFRNPQSVGTPVSEDSTSTTICPICHFKVNNPIKIPCGHIFCHTCSCVWFDREPHCPVCAAQSLHAIVTGQTRHMPPQTRITAKCSRWKTGTTEYLVQLF